MAPRYAKTAFRRPAARFQSGGALAPAIFIGSIGVAVGCGASDSAQLFGPARSRGEPEPIVRGSGTGGRDQGSGGATAESGGEQTITVGSGGDTFVPGGAGGILPPAGGDTGAGGQPAGGADAGPSPMSDGGAPMMMPPKNPAACSYAGTWGTLIRVPVSWPAAPFVLNGGDGEVVQWNISHRVQDSLVEYHEQTALCGISLPDLAGSILQNDQKFGIRFPNPMFDRNVLPSFTFKTTVSLNNMQIAWEVKEPLALLTGLTMANPTTTPWPTSFDASDTPDQDGDGATGVTVLPVNPMQDPSYNWPPVGLPPYWGADYPRAARISVVVRTVSTMHGTVAGCDELDGSVDIQKIGSSPALNSMVIGCTKIDGQVCADSEAQFLNAARPVFTPSGPGTLVSVRLPDNAGCPEVRAKLPLPH